MGILKIAEVIKLLQEKKKKFGNLPCVTSKDDEGNGYNEVIFAPSQMRFKKEGYNLELEWEHLEKGEKEDKPTHICIN